MKRKVEEDSEKWRWRFFLWFKKLVLKETLDLL
jgi:hypothetical protein